MGLGARVNVGRNRRSKTRKVLSPAAAAYSPITLSSKGAAKFGEIIDPKSTVGKPTRAPRAALRRDKVSRT